MTHSGFGFPQLPYSSLAFPFSGVSVVGKAWLPTSFLLAQLLPLRPLHGVIPSFLRVGRNLPLKPREYPLRVRTNPRCFRDQVWRFGCFVFHVLCFEGFPWCDNVSILCIDKLMRVQSEKIQSDWAHEMNYQQFISSVGE
jgi:hypothetical protein